jgi:hypothetical protein
MRSHEVLQKMIKPVGAKAVASHLRLSTPLIYKWCEAGADENGAGAANPLDRLTRLMEATNSVAPLDWLCERTGSFRVVNPLLEPCAVEGVLAASQTILKEFSDVLEAVSEGYSNGSRIDAEEAVRIRREWEELKRVGEAFVRACEAGLYDTATEKQEDA